LLGIRLLLSSYRALPPSQVKDADGQEDGVSNKYPRSELWKKKQERKKQSDEEE
jgi:hypothetical protein